MVNRTNFAIAIMDYEKIDEINRIIGKFAKIARETSSHILFDTMPVAPSEITHDLTFFQIETDDDFILNKKLKDMISNLDESNTDYILRNEDSGELVVFPEYVGSIRIKFDNLEIVKKGTYKRIDELKLLKTEMGYCKGYKPKFRPIEENPIEGKAIKDETIYLFSDSSENLLKFNDFLCEKVMEIDEKFELEVETFYKGLQF
jgi:hypothetical protein